MTTQMKTNYVRNYWVDLDYISVEFLDGDEYEIDMQSFISFYNEFNDGIKPELTEDDIQRRFVVDEICRYLEVVERIGEVFLYPSNC